MTADALKLGIFGVLITLGITGLALLGLAPFLPNGLPISAAILTVSCLGATDSGALEDLLVILRKNISGGLRHLLEFEAAISTVVTLLVFGFVAGVLQDQARSSGTLLDSQLTGHFLQELWSVGLHITAGIVAALVVGVMAPRLINLVVRSDQMLLLAAVSLAFVAYGLGQILGGGGLIAVFVAGVLFANGKNGIVQFEQQALVKVMHPVNTVAEVTVLLLLGLLVQPAVAFKVLPLGILLAIVLPLARLIAVATISPAACPTWPKRALVSGCGVRAAVPLALAVSMTESLPNLPGMNPELAEPLSTQLLALIFVIVFTDLLLQTFLVRRLFSIMPNGCSPDKA